MPWIYGQLTKKMWPGTVTEFDSSNPHILDQYILIIDRTITHELISVYSSKKGLDQTKYSRPCVTQKYLRALDLWSPNRED